MSLQKKRSLKDIEEPKQFKIASIPPIGLTPSSTQIDRVPLAIERIQRHEDIEEVMEEESKRFEGTIFLRNFSRQHSEYSHHSRTSSVQSEIEYLTDESRTGRHRKCNSVGDSLTSVLSIAHKRGMGSLIGKKRARADVDISHSSSSRYSLSPIPNIKPPKKSKKRDNQQQIQIIEKQNTHPFRSNDQYNKSPQTKNEEKKQRFYPAIDRAQSDTGTQNDSYPWIHMDSLSWEEQINDNENKREFQKKISSDHIKNLKQQKRKPEDQENESSVYREQRSFRYTERIVEEEKFNPNPLLFNEKNDRELKGTQGALFVKNLFEDHGCEWSIKFQSHYRYKYLIIILVALYGHLFHYPDENINQLSKDKEFPQLVQDALYSLAKSHGISVEECDMLQISAKRVCRFEDIYAILHYLKIQASFLQDCPLTLLYETLMYLSMYGFEENQSMISQIICRFSALLNIAKEDTAYILLLFESEFHLLKIYRHLL